MSFTLESPSFPDGGAIPPRHVRDGDNVSPELRWSGAPDGTQSFVLVVEDPDAPSGTFRHWALFDIAATSERLTEGAANLPVRVGQGVNDFGNAGYDGPRPPRGHGVHHYHFRLLALDVATLGIDAPAPIEAILKRAAPHVVAETELVGTFEAP
jgi:Raf kinase inhibitor-like protein, YbhB/YbcL family